MAAGSEHSGYLLDVYADPFDGRLAVWFLTDTGERLRLSQRFPLSFYAAGPHRRLRALWQFLSQRYPRLELARTTRRSLFLPQPLTLLRVTVAQAMQQPEIFQQVTQAFPDLDYYDGDVALMARYAAQWDIFPLTRCRAWVNAQNEIENIAPLETRWEIDPSPLPLRIMTLAPDSDPFKTHPAHLMVQYEQRTWQLKLQPERALLTVLESLLRQYDPDLILSDWGDTWLLPWLLEKSEQLPGLLHLNRDASLTPQRKRARTYQSYGQIVYRGQQVQLYGRWHIDRRNAMMYGDYGLDGIFELARVSGLPVQVAARNSPGAGITAMQMITALRSQVLVPYRRQQAEFFKSAEDLISADRGGLVGSPQVGIFEHVAEIDFVSMYPSIIRKFNISPETVNETGEETQVVPGVNLKITQDTPGLLPVTIAPLVDKRIAIKQASAALDARDCRLAGYRSRAAAIKWLLVVSFGYAGYRNAKFGRIEAHQAITAYAREVLLQAKQVAEERGYEVLHMYVDCLWVRKPGDTQAADFQPLLEAVTQATGLPIALDGVFRWIAFLPSKLSPQLGVANRYFGVFQSGEIKARGIETRRHDTCAFVASVQKEMLQRMAKTGSKKEIRALLPELVALLQGHLRRLYRGQVAADQLVLRQRLTRRPEAYRAPSPAALAAAQLEKSGRTMETGQQVSFVYTWGRPGACAWELPEPFDTRRLNYPRYARLLLRAAHALLEPAGVTSQDLYSWIQGLPAGTTPPLLPLWSPRAVTPADAGGVTRLFVPAAAVVQPAAVLPEPELVQAGG